MKTITPSIKKLGFIVILCVLFNTYNTNSQIRLVKVEPAANEITIHNYGTTTVDISTYWFCALFAYTQLNNGLTIESGSLNLAANADVVISGFSLNNDDSDVGLYLPINTNADFGNQSFMVDFMQYGDAGNGRESVANGKGIWATGDFLTGTGPFFYNGNGSENGLTAWGTTLSTNDEFLNTSLSVYPNPVKENITVRELRQVGLKNASIFDATGRIVGLADLNTNLSEKVINLNNIQSGLYFLKLTDIEGRILTKKFIKE